MQESTKKSSVNYVFVFYNAMIIFAKKHFSQSHANTFSFLIKIAIYFRALIAIINRLVKKLSLPILDYIVSVALLFFVAYFYQELKPIELKQSLLNTALPTYGMVWLVAMFFSGVYDKPIKLAKVLKGGVIGTAFILIIYGLLPKTVQFSRLIIVIGFATTVIAFLGVRLTLHLLKIKGFSLNSDTKKRFVIVGSFNEAERVKTILEQNSNIESISNISPTNNNEDGGYDAIINQLEDYIRINKINEVVFCAKDMTAQQIIHQMSNVAVEENVDFKIAQPNSLFLIGSNSIHTSGDIYLLDLNNITKPENIRNKRFFDILSALVLLLLSPILLFVQKKPLAYISNSFKVLFGKLTWVGFNKTNEGLKLPNIKEGVLKITAAEKEQPPELLHKLNMIYAKDYNVATDFKILIKNLKFLGS